ncbi:hypothetical protein Vafri_13263 [Volvox africanus]|uniref:Uncharacterized protein n=1 Tax=Volvox africanus TaxID=51714 RepID=A0A8J4F337_9CHLO|nr:hypothetical protein Vafri_13263 [Volvox africanus]
MDLVLERDRMYLLGAVGRFGAVPITITGDMDLNPDTGTYRLQSNVPGSGVEVNALRATLGVRPIPISAAGAVRGVLHCTGPLERPIFSGSAIAVRPSPEQLAAGLEDTPALAALRGHNGAVAAYDKVPLLGVQAVFTLDMATQMLNVHSVQAQPDGGGSLLATGRMWLAPEAESDPRAISITGEAEGVDADRLARYYMPPDVELPDGVQLGSASVRGQMAGSHLAPGVDLTAEAPAARVTGSASFSQKAISMSARGPAFSVDGTVHTSLPYFDELRASETQAEATYYARPRFMGADLELHCAAPGADLLPLATGPATPPPFDPLAANQPLHLRVAGHARLALRPAPGGGGGGGGFGAGTGAGVLQQQGRRGTAAPTPPSGAHDSRAGPKKFAGSISLSGIRINSLELVRSLSGTAAVDGEAGTVAVRARGPGVPVAGGALAAPSMVATGPAAGAAAAAAGGGGGPGVGSLATDVLDFEVAVPDLMAALNLEAAGPPPLAIIYRPAPAAATSGTKATAAVRADGAPAAGSSWGPANVMASIRTGSARTDGSVAPPALQPSLPHWSPSGSVQRPSVGTDGAAERSVSSGGGGAHPPSDATDSRFLLSRGPLLLEAEVVNGGSELSVQIANLQLDDLEAGSLRGSLRAASLEADVAGRRGRGSCSAEGLRLSSLAVGSFGGAVRWEGDIVKLEETVLVQSGSRYEVSGEVFLPGFGAAPSAVQASSHPSFVPAAAAAASSSPTGEAEAAEASIKDELTHGSRAAYRADVNKRGVSRSGNDPWVSGAGGGKATNAAALRPGLIASQAANGSGGGAMDAVAAAGGPVASSAATTVTAAEAVAGSVTGEEVGPSDCRWRLQINVPSAQISDLLPAVQLATSASRPGTDYGAAKARFLEAIQSGAASAVSPPDVRLQVDLFSHLPSSETAVSSGPTGRSARPWRTRGSVGTATVTSLPSAGTSSATSPQAVAGTAGTDGGQGTTSSGVGGGRAGGGAAGGGSDAVPALSELSGNWSGNIQLYGGLSGPSSVDFSLAGRDWRWGPSYRLDRLVAVGSADGTEGVALEELTIDAGPAQLRASGSLLCPRQEARLELYDFPLDAFAPITNTAWPALERAAAAAKARGAAQASPLAGAFPRVRIS